MEYLPHCLHLHHPQLQGDDDEDEDDEEEGRPSRFGVQWNGFMLIFHAREDVFRESEFEGGESPHHSCR